MAIKEQEGEFTSSSIGQALTYDTRDNRFSTKKGLRATYSNEFAGLGGDTTFVKNELNGSVFYPITDDIIGSFSAGMGYIFGINDDVRIVNRFFLGGNDLRGFDNSGVGPRDVATEDAVGGKWFYRGSLQVSFPLGLPNELGIRGRVFTDLGSLGGIDGGAGAVTDTGSVRASTGTGLGWKSPFGPINIDFAKAFLKEDFDETQVFRFSFGTRF